MKKTILHWGDTAKSAGSTSRSASTAVESDFFIAQDISFVVGVPELSKLINIFQPSSL